MSKALTTVSVHYKDGTQETFKCVEIIQSPEVYMLIHCLNNGNGRPNSYTYISVSDVKIMRVANDTGESRALQAINECDH